MNIPAMLYAMECEGLIDTPEGKRNAFLRALRRGRYYGLMHKDIFREEAAAAGFTDNEIAKMREEYV